MRSIKKSYNRLRIIRSLVLMTLISCVCNKLMAAEEPYVNEIRGPQVAVNNFFTVSDEKFNSGTEWAKIDQHISVNDIITFEINFDTSIYFYNTPFVSTIGFKVYIYGNQADTSQITDSVTHNNISLDIKYDTVTGKPYKGIAYYKFKDAHKFKVKILSLVCPQLSPILPIFRLKGQIIIERQYKFTDVTTDPTQFSIINGNQLKLEWIPSAYAGAEMFDLEYTFIDKHSREGQSIAGTQNGDTTFTIPTDSLKKWFKNNCSRVTTANPQHIVNLTYDSGYILFRIRGIQIHYGDEVRWEGDWNYYARKAGSGACSGTCPSGAALIIGHEQDLNWQFAISFAEEGKQKQVISYFDGSLRNRQSVTINNSDNKSIVQETIYDALGRPAASILPSPANDSTFHYFRGYNVNAAYDPYSFSDLKYETCSTEADPLSDSSGTSRYYSAKNDFKNKYYYAKYIPDAQDFPMTVTEYMPDNTGRIKAQGGVGAVFQLGSGPA